MDEAVAMLYADCMVFRFSETLKGASVVLLISSTVTPSASSISVKPSVKSTSNTH